MKTSDEIKKGLFHCMGDYSSYHCGKCPYRVGETRCDDRGVKMFRDALAYIQQLEAYKSAWTDALPRLSEAEGMKETIECMRKRLDRAEKERDAALHDLMMMGIIADREDREYLCQFCGSDSPLRCEYCKDRAEEAFVWRGVCAENTKENK